MYVAMNPERVRGLRRLRGMSKRELAACAGVSETTARRAESGQPVHGSTARAVAVVLGERPSDSLGRVVRG